ncbi:MAG TPA: sugar transferase [Sedimentisphaerales bacterium]|nr:sugar transferase [Sedimentisphaerales bacterium]
MTINSNNPEYSRYLDSWRKRCFDVVACSLMLVPALIALGLAALVILIREGRPIFFIHQRAGKEGRLFWMPKLRTLRRQAKPYEPFAHLHNASFVTPTGDFLRRHKLDELPQLFSVLTGRMSLIGPRPALPNVVEGYDSFQRKRLLARPGVTGLWQVMGNHHVGMHEDMKYDLYYLRRASLWLDIKILAMTVPVVLNLEREKK